MEMETQNLKFLNICRVCLKEYKNIEDMKLIYDTNFISYHVENFGNIMLDNDNLPNRICQKCINQLEISIKFRSVCESSDKILECYILTGEFQNCLNDQLPTESNEILIDKHVILKEIDEDGIICMKIDLKQEDKAEYTEVNTKNVNSESSNECIISAKQVEIVGTPKYNETVVQGIEKKSAVKEKYECDLCDSSYVAKNALIYHMRRHRNELNFICEQCGAAFETNFKLKRHYNKHTGFTPYPCRHCEEKFSHSSNRDRHERRLHTLERPFQCNLCIKKFPTLIQLKNHKRVHTGEKPYICGKCGVAFRRKTHLASHRKSVTPCYLKYSLKQNIDTD